MIRAQPGDPPRGAVIVCDDDPAVREFIADNLTADGFEIRAVGTGGQAIALAERIACDLLLLDVVLPDGSGIDVCREIRSRDPVAGGLDPFLPIIMLSGRAAEDDRIRGLAAGADDYIAKPFNYQELAARISGLLWRAQARGRGGAVRVGDLVVDPSTRTVRLGGQTVNVTGKEFAMLVRMASEPERVFTRRELMEQVWGFRAPGASRTVDTHASRLRRKLSTGGRRFMVNTWGVGYRLVEDGPC